MLGVDVPPPGVRMPVTGYTRREGSGVIVPDVDIEPGLGAWCGHSTPDGERRDIRAIGLTAVRGLPLGYRYPDVSKFRPVIGWDEFAAAYPIAACKATEGMTYVDPTWSEFLANCRKRGILPIAYHFLRRETSTTEQARHFVRQLDGGPCGYMLDVETSGTGTNPTMAQADAWLAEVADLTGRVREQILVYLPRWWWRTYGGGSTLLCEAMLCNSDYRATPDLTPFAGFGVPDVIQYSSSAPIAGVTEPGDMNIAIDRTAAQFAAALGCGTTEEDVVDEATVGRIARATVAELTRLAWVPPEDPPADWHPPRQADIGAVIRRTYEQVGAEWTMLDFLYDCLVRVAKASGVILDPPPWRT